MAEEGRIISSTTGGLVMLAEIRAQLPPSERKIADYILNNPEKTISSTVSELGKYSSTSGATVVRLCKSLGLKGFQELKIRITGDLQKNVHEGYRDIQPSEPQASVIQKMTNNSIQALRETADIIHSGEFSKAVEALLTARNILFFGVGASGIISDDAQQKFIRINKKAIAFKDLHIAGVYAANITADDVFMGISFSGETEEVVKLIELAKRKGATTISLTRYGSSPASDKADIKLYSSASKEAVFRSGATSSRLAQLHVIDILFMCVATQQYNEAIFHLDQTREALSYLKNKTYKK